MERRVVITGVGPVSSIATLLVMEHGVITLTGNREISETPRLDKR